jgi:hypothetical protein
MMIPCCWKHTPSLDTLQSKQSVRLGSSTTSTRARNTPFKRQKCLAAECKPYVRYTAVKAINASAKEERHSWGRRPTCKTSTLILGGTVATNCLGVRHTTSGTLLGTHCTPKVSRGAARGWKSSIENHNYHSHYYYYYYYYYYCYYATVLFVVVDVVKNLKEKINMG